MFLFFIRLTDYKVKYFGTKIFNKMDRVRYYKIYQRVYLLSQYSDIQWRF